VCVGRRKDASITRCGVKNFSRWSLMGKKTGPIVPFTGRLGLLGRFWKGYSPAAAIVTRAVFAMVLIHSKFSLAAVGGDGDDEW
jgi:hypothetical protein